MIIYFRRKILFSLSISFSSSDLNCGTQQSFNVSVECTFECIQVLYEKVKCNSFTRIEKLANLLLNPNMTMPALVSNEYHNRNGTIFSVQTKDGELFYQDLLKVMTDCFFASPLSFSFSYKYRLF